MKLVHWDHVDAALGVISDNKKAIYEHNLQYEAKTAGLFKKVDAIRSKMLEKTEPLAAEIEELEKSIQAFALQHQVTSAVELKNGTVKVREGKEKVETLPDTTMETVIQKITEFFKKRYIRIKTELNKQLLIADFRSGKVDNKKLEPAGLKIVKEKSFSYELK